MTATVTQLRPIPREAAPSRARVLAEVAFGHDRTGEELAGFLSACTDIGMDLAPGLRADALAELRSLRAGGS